MQIRTFCKQHKKHIQSGTTPFCLILRLRVAHGVVLLGDGQEELELRGKLLLRVEAVGEIDAADAAVGVYLHAQRLDVVRAIRAAREVRQVELDLVPAFVQSHRHGTNEGFYAGC